jgi:hypothetical protein
MPQAHTAKFVNLIKRFLQNFKLQSRGHVKLSLIAIQLNPYTPTSQVFAGT